MPRNSASVATLRIDPSVSGVAKAEANRPGLGKNALEGETTVFSGCVDLTEDAENQRQPALEKGSSSPATVTVERAL